MTEDKIEAFRALSQDLIALVEKHLALISTMDPVAFANAVEVVREAALAPMFRFDTGFGWDVGRTL